MSNILSHSPLFSSETHSIIQRASLPSQGYQSQSTLCPYLGSLSILLESSQTPLANPISMSSNLDYIYPRRKLKDWITVRIIEYQLIDVNRAFRVLAIPQKTWKQRWTVLKHHWRISKITRMQDCAHITFKQYHY